MQQIQYPHSLGDIHSQWHLDRHVIFALILVAQFVEVRNVIVFQGRRRPMGASNNSTHRDPSGFELVESVDTGDCCGHCVVREIGHNPKTCPECSRIILIQRPVLAESAMEVTSNADSVSLYNSCGPKRRAVICNLWRQPLQKKHLVGIEICDYL